MRRIHARGLCAALEEEQVIEAAVAAADPAAVVADPVEQLDNADSLETELLEVQETVDEGVTQETQVEEAVEVSEALGEYQEALESIAKQGGLDRNGAMILHIGLEQLRARVGVTGGKVTMPSMESFGGASQRVRATQLAMESIAETAGKVWAAILAAIKRAGEWLKNFWKTLTDSNHRLKARAEKVKAAAAAAKGEAAGELENAGLAGKLHINGKVEKTFDREFAEFASFCEVMAGKVVPGVVAYSKQIAESIPKSVADQESEDITFRAADAKAAYAGVKLSAGEAAGEGIESLKSDQLPGGKALLVQVPTADGVAGAMVFAKCKTTVGLFAPATAKATSDKLPVLGKNSVDTIVNGVLTTTKAVDTLRAHEKDFDAFIKSMSVGASQFTKQQDLANDPGNAKVVAMKKKLAAARALFSSLTTRVSNMPANFGGYALSTSKSAMDYCELSLKAYK